MAAWLETLKEELHPSLGADSSKEKEQIADAKALRWV